MKNRIISEIKECLDMYNYDDFYSPLEINNLYQAWHDNKKVLKDLLSRHPNWNKTTMAITFDIDHEREVDRDLFLKSLETLVADFEKSNDFKKLSDCDVNYLQRVFNILRLHGDKTFVNEFFEAVVNDSKDILNYNGNLIFNCSIGQKMSRVLNRYFTKLNMDKLECYNRVFAQLSDSLNPLKIKRHTVLSIHPCDYLHMSYGNSWSSCHHIDNNEGGCHKAGTLSYMCDGVSMIFATIDGKYDGETYWTQPKISRQMFMYNDGALLQSRLYPDFDDVSTLDNYRNIVQKIFSEILDVPNRWVLNRGVATIDKSVTKLYGAKHYHVDYMNETYNPTISFLRDRVSGGDNISENFKIKVGFQVPCLSCGGYFREFDNLICESCYKDGEYCDECDHFVDSNSVRWVNGISYCEDCVDYCYLCEEYYIGNDYFVYNVEGGNTGRYICEYCVNNSSMILQCDECEEYYYNKILYSVDSGDIYICGDCLDKGVQNNRIFCCGECKEYFSTDFSYDICEGLHFCEDCLVFKLKGEDIFRCDSCGELYFSHHMSEVKGFCEGCFESHSIIKVNSESGDNNNNED